MLVLVLAVVQISLRESAFNYDNFITLLESRIQTWFHGGGQYKKASTPDVNAIPSKQGFH